MKLHVGARVVLSDIGKACHVREHWERQGTVIGLCKTDERRRVFWDGRKCIDHMHINFLEEIDDNKS